MQHISDNLKRIAKVGKPTKKNAFKVEPKSLKAKTKEREIKEILGSELDTDLLDFMIDDSLFNDWY